MTSPTAQRYASVEMVRHLPATQSVSTERLAKLTLRSTTMRLLRTRLTVAAASATLAASSACAPRQVDTLHLTEFYKVWGNITSFSLNAMKPMVQIRTFLFIFYRVGL